MSFQVRIQGLEVYSDLIDFHLPMALHDFEKITQFFENWYSNLKLELTPVETNV